MLTTDKYVCSLLVKTLRKYGVEDAVLCPGSRDLPLITAFVAEGEIRCHSIVDERSAAFFALGISEVRDKAVALVCTSGTAVLNFAPAVAEALYKHRPLVVISADRPAAWIDQEDSQTIRQNGVLANIVKKNIVIEENADTLNFWHVERSLNEIMLYALEGPQGPVHINVPLSKPLFHLVESSEMEIRDIRVAPVVKNIAKDFVMELGKEFQSGKKILIAGASHSPSHSLSRSLEKLSQFNNVVTVLEPLTNVHLSNHIVTFGTISALTDEEWDELCPDILITFGGPFVSQKFKELIRRSSGRIKHWHVSQSQQLVDTFQCLAMKIQLDAASFFTQLRQSLRKTRLTVNSNYAMLWEHIAFQVEQLRAKILDDDPAWCDLSIMNRVLHALPKTYNVQVSNGMAVRYFNSLPMSFRFHRADSNRGVSGIDGSTSTALGAAAAFDGTTVLLTGDMSARYDFGAMLDAARFTHNFKMLVFANGGGNIFRMIEGSVHNEILRDYVYAMEAVNWKGLETLARWHVAEVASWSQLPDAMEDWLSKRTEPSLLVVCTNAETNATFYKHYVRQRN